MSKWSAKLPGAVLLLGASFVQAQDAKVLPGSICQPRNGTVNYPSSGSITNLSSTSTMAAMCPLVRDNATATSPIINSASVWVVNRGPATTSVRCTICAHFTNSLASQCSSATSSSISSLPQQITLTAPSVPSGTGHALDIECSLPPTQSGNSSAVRNIAWAEP
jgi:hypothetical protein